MAMINVKASLPPRHEHPCKWLNLPGIIARGSAEPAEYSKMAQSGQTIDGAVQRDFLKEAIKDTQGTIRALDTKANIALVAMTLLLSNIDKLAVAVHLLEKHAASYTVLLVSLTTVLAICAWILAVIAAVRTLYPISNPSASIVSGDRALGTFFAHRKTRRWPTLFIDPMPEHVELSGYISLLPNSESQAIDEFSFEMLKLAYIRDVKATRLRFAYPAFAIALFSCAALWVAALTMSAMPLGANK